MAFISDLLAVETLHVPNEKLNIFNFLNDGFSLGIISYDFIIHRFFVLPAAQEAIEISFGPAILDF